MPASSIKEVSLNHLSAREVFYVCRWGEATGMGNEVDARLERTSSLSGPRRPLEQQCRTAVVTVRRKSQVASTILHQVGEAGCL